MYEQIKKPKENKSWAIANSVARKKSNGKQGFRFVDNRPIQMRKLQEIANRGAEIAQLTKMLRLQNNPTVKEKQWFADALQRENATQITDVNAVNNIQDDETIIVIAHGNTDVIGDEGNEEQDLEISPSELADIINKITPPTWKGNLFIRSCSAAVTPHDEGIATHDSFLQRTYQEFLKLRSASKNTFSGAMGAIDYEFSDNVNVRVPPPITKTNGKNMPLDSAMVRLHPVEESKWAQVRAQEGEGAAPL